MGIIKVKKYDCPYVQMDKRPLSDPRLTWKAKGILAYLLSKPDDWQVWVNDLVKQSRDGASAVRAGLDELLATGYATRQQVRQENGTFSGTDYIVYEQPFSGFPHADKPHTDKPHAENRHDTNNESTNEQSTNNEQKHGANAPAPPAPPATPEPVQEKKPLTPGQAVFTALAEVCQIDLTTLTAKQRGALNQSGKKLRQADAGPAELATFGTWWYAYDWRGKRGEPPRPHQVREVWGQFIIYSNGGHRAKQSTNPRAPNYCPPLATRAV